MLREFLMEFFSFTLEDGYFFLRMLSYCVVCSMIWTKVIEPWLDKRERGKSYFVRPTTYKRRD